MYVLPYYVHLATNAHKHVADSSARHSVTLTVEGLQKWTTGDPPVMDSQLSVSISP